MVPLTGIALAMVAFSFDDSVESEEMLFWLHAVMGLMLLPLSFLLGLMYAVAAVRKRSRWWFIAIPALIVELLPVAYMLLRWSV
ncbi:MAG: hypothetical protein B7Z47_03155 [Chthoniobacter sp. 12-60-6]|nr:MAG: hypothetical protein B7Z47_03155 [Chthoniobacter sp. 12-60-6]